MRKLLIYLFLAIMVIGCAAPKKIAVQVVPDQSYLFAEVMGGDTTINPNWWEIFSDTTLNTLIEMALENNRNVMIAASRIEQSRYALDIARSEYLPAFTASVSATGTYDISSNTGKKSISQIYSLLPAVSWDLSLFGALKNATEAARNQILSTQWAYRAVRLSLAAQVATTYFEWLQYARSLEISERSYSLRIQAQQRIDSMYHYGFSSAVDLEQARSLTATAAADIPAYRRAVVQTNLALNILLGQTPELMSMPEPINYSAYNGEQLMGTIIQAGKLPIAVPQALPSDLLERRPDVVESYYAMEAAAAKVRLARAQRFPTISLTGSGGLLAYSVKALTEHNPFYWTATGALTEPLFAFGRLKRNEQSAYEDYRQSVLDYEQTMLTALSDVETALVAITTYSNQVPKYVELVEANRKLQVMTAELYRDGLSSYLNVIDAERNFYSTQLQYIQILTEQLSAYVNLYSALGGGW